MPACYGYMSELEGLLALAERGCLRLMKTGGGPLERDNPARSPLFPITPEEKAQMHRLLDEGVEMKEIAKRVGRPYNSCARCTRPYREKLGMPVRTLTPWASGK